MVIKSSYELVMERLNKQSAGSGRKLTDADRRKLAELNRVYAAKIAERELALTPQIEAARSSGDFETADKLSAQLRDEIQLLRQERERKKDAVRAGR